MYSSLIKKSHHSKIKKVGNYAVGFLLGLTLITQAHADYPPVVSPVVIYDDLSIYGNSIENGNLFNKGNIYINSNLGGDGTLNIGILGQRHHITGTINVDGNMAVQGNSTVLGAADTQSLNVYGNIFLNDQPLTPADFESNSPNQSSAGSIYEVRGRRENISNNIWISTTTGCRNESDILLSCEAKITPTNADIKWIKDLKINNRFNKRCSVSGAKKPTSQNATIEPFVKCYSPN